MQDSSTLLCWSNFFYNSTIVQSRPKTQILLESTACALRTISIVHPRHKTRLLNNCEAMGCLGARKWARGQDFTIKISQIKEKDEDLEVKLHFWGN